MRDDAELYDLEDDLRVLDGLIAFIALAIFVAPMVAAAALLAWWPVAWLFTVLYF